MSKQKTNRDIVFYVTFIALALIISVICVLTGGFMSDGYDIRPLTISNRLIQSPRDIVNETATRNRREQAAERARSNPLYMLDNEITQDNLQKLDTFFDEIEVMRRLHNPITDPTGSVQEPVAVSSLPRSTLPLDVSINAHFNFLITSSNEVYTTFRDRITDVAKTRMMSGIKENDLHIAQNDVRFELGQIDEWDSVVKEVGYSIITQVLWPNFFEDTESIEIAAQAAMDAVEPVVIYRGQNIVIEGQLITQEIYDIIESLGMLRQTMFERITPVIGALLSVAAVFIVGLTFMATVYKRLLSDKKNVVLLFTLYTLTVVTAWLLQGMSFVLVPILLFTMLATVLLDEGLGVGFCMCVSVVCSVIHAADVSFIAFFIIAGLFVTITAKLITERSKMLSVTALVSGFCFLTVCALHLVADNAVTKEMWDTAVIAALFGMFSVVLCVGILPFFETMFGFVTTIKLVDLANPNNPLLRRLIIEAPGTYQHSLVVANLAETACYSIGADHALARIGGYYHDCGKVNYPSYFIENIADGVNPHDSMDPYVSVKVISEHVSNGLVLADKYKLPKPIRAFIEEHHGGAVQKYFLHKALESAEKSGETVNECDFKYKFRIPQSRETAIVMLADIVEATVRSAMPGKPNMDELKETVTSLVRAPLIDGRLEDSGLVIKDLTTIADAFMRVFRGIYHERVAYPTAAKPAQDTHETPETPSTPKIVKKAPKKLKNKEIRP